MLKRFWAVALAAALIVFGGSVPASASGYDFAVTVSATSDLTVPSVLTWEIEVASVGDAMGQDLQTGSVEFDVPTSISLIVPGQGCYVVSRHVTCDWAVFDNDPQQFQVQGLVSLLAVGQITITPTITISQSFTDSNSSNDSDSVSCTAVLMLATVC